jgi:hypothetical protein
LFVCDLRDRVKQTPTLDEISNEVEKKRNTRGENKR